MRPQYPFTHALLSVLSNLRPLHFKLSSRPKQSQADRVGSAKRYERMMKANGIHQSQSGGTTVSSIRDTPNPSPRRKTSPSAGPSNKKRKLDEYAETTSNFNTDDDEGLSNVKAESSTTVKAENVKAEHVKAESIKKELTGHEGTQEPIASTGNFQYPSSGTMGFDGAHDSTLFDDFLAFGGSVPSMSMTPATGNDDGLGPHESILITD